MAEVLGIVSAALGLLPLAVQVAKGFHTLCKTVKTAKACTKELEVLDIDIRTQERIFINECELILHIVSSNSHEPQMMTHDLESPLWLDGTLENRVKTCMAQSYEQCIEIIKAMRESQNELLAELNLFAIVRTEKGPHESMRVAFRRLRKSLAVSYDMGSFERKVDRIRQYNVGICSIRSQIGDFQRIQSKEATSQIAESTALPSWVSKMHDISKDAYTTLDSAFSCQVDEHITHFAALRAGDCIERHRSIQLDMAIAYCVTRDSQTHQLLRFSLESCLPRLEWQPKAQKKGKQVQFTQPSLGNQCSGTQEQVLSSIANLSTIDNVCAYLEASTQAPSSADYLAYLYEASMCQHSFYVTADRKAQSLYSSNQLGTLRDLMLDGEANLSITDQFNLAVQLTLAVLQFYSTPWLRETWSTSDFLLGASDHRQQARQPDLFLRSRCFGGSAEDTDATEESGPNL
ncbi:hypothetical protein B0I35DRAFT_481137 [Stachybotrys elegans]|uniref:Fungal N-terminal domain-containing protein n=1 Tax=Stachybotrys elegans TaxID=80388 RepID=A0A8K0SNR8_9HYPO|nr:hypothetical protein B0I35DRAFT_481137 [Stachybotrys elegans]